MFAEGIITVILLLLLNLSIMVLLQQAIVNNPQLRGGVWMIKNAIAIGPNGWHIWSWQKLVCDFDGDCGCASGLLALNSPLSPNADVARYW